MNVRLISVTPDAEKTMAYVARVSNPKNQTNENYAKLLGYCIKHQHWSVFEQSFMTLEIETTRGLAAQILRHRSFTFQEFCMSGDTEVYFDLPNSVSKNKRSKYTLSLEHLYKNWIKSEHSKNRIRNMNVRIFDEESKTLSHSHIKEVFQTGVKDIFEITLENGKKIKSTKEHKVLTKSGFLSLEDCIGLNVVNNTAVMTKNTFIGCNGVLLHQDYEWLREAKIRNIENKKGLSGISDDAGVSYHTIRKWLKKYGLSFTKNEVSQYTQVWNKGKFGYSTGSRSEYTRKKMRESARRGNKSNLWKGGTSGERKMIQCDISSYRKKLIEDYNNSCGLCGEKLSGSVHLHHIIPVSENISLAREYTNLMPVHSDCHMKHHSLNGDCKKWKEKSSGNTLTVSWSKVKQVKYLGKQMTYDLEIDHKSHNYVADGVIVHNSQRYADSSLLSDTIPIPDIRRQDTKNRQNSIDDIDPFVVQKYQMLIQDHFRDAMALYKTMLDEGIAKECARFVLPLATPTRLYMSGSCRSWVHYIQLRSSNGTQKEHMDIALACKEIFSEQFPTVAEALEWV